MKKTRFMQMKDQMLLHCDAGQWPRLVELMDEEYRMLYAAYEDRPDALQKHLHNNIFPVVTAFHGLMALGLSRKEAAEASQAAFLELMDAPANAIRNALKVPGLHRLFPWLFKTLMPKLFGEEAGFRFHIYPTGPHQAKFDMLQCPYFKVCQELDCTDIAQVFCDTDDTCYGNMHPNLIWNRTKTLARGGDLCDFDLYLKKR